MSKRKTVSGGESFRLRCRRFCVGPSILRDIKGDNFLIHFDVTRGAGADRVRVTEGDEGTPKGLEGIAAAT